MKRIFSVALALIITFGACFSLSASAADLAGAEPLRFDENGEFKIMHLCDCQDETPADSRMMSFIDAALKEYKPDLVVLGGDNTTGPENTKEAAIKELVTPFVENEVYFTLVFGNHDREQGWSNDELLPLYQKYGGKYCLAYDAVPSLHGTATHMLPVLGSGNSLETKFAVYMFDSGSHVYECDENGNPIYNENGELIDLGYDSVTPDQIEWYKDTSDDLAETAGKKVNGLAFQHIVVGDIYDALFRESAVSLGVLTPSYNGKTYSFLPKTENVNGFLFEFPCPGYYNHGQFDAMVKQGDILGIFSGHDHINSYDVEHRGIRIVNTPGATYSSYGNDLVRGMRMITVKESDTSTFETEVVTVNDLVLANDSFASEVGISGIVATLTNIGADILLALGKFSGIFSAVITAIFG